VTQALVEAEERDPSSTTTRELRQIHSLVVTAGGSYPRPMLVSQIQYLYGMTTRADQLPGRDAYVRYEELKGQLGELRERFRKATQES